jgi:hypothetical protein
MASARARVSGPAEPASLPSYQRALGGRRILVRSGDRHTLWPLAGEVNLHASIWTRGPLPLNCKTLWLESDAQIFFDSFSGLSVEPNFDARTTGVVGRNIL